LRKKPEGFVLFTRSLLLIPGSITVVQSEFSWLKILVVMLAIVHVGSGMILEK
jgi:hypothetical protein